MPMMGWVGQGSKLPHGNKQEDKPRRTNCRVEGERSPPLYLPGLHRRTKRCPQRSKRRFRGLSALVTTGQASRRCHGHGAVHERAAKHAARRAYPGVLGSSLVVSTCERAQPKKAHTFNMIWEELCPPSDASRLPGKPAVSQFEQMSMSIVVQSTQRKRAPTMSCWQLRSDQRKCIEASEKNHPLEALDPGVFEGYQKVSINSEKSKAAYKAHPYSRKFRRHSIVPGSLTI